MKLSLPEVLPVAEAYYKANPCGGNLHIVLDDENIEDCNIKFCLIQAERHGDKPGVELCQKMLHLSLTQRKKLVRLLR